MFILVGPFIWFIKTNDALNDYWRSQGAAGLSPRSQHWWRAADRQVWLHATCLAR